MIPDGFAPFVPRVAIVRSRAQTATVEPDTSVEEVLPGPDATDRDAVAEFRDEVARSCDETQVAASVRERAIKIAGEACARALREAIARNRLFVARFVDDAIEAAGPGSSRTVRLSPIDAAACQGRLGTSVVADEGVAPGEVVVETEHGKITATVDQRALLLVRAVADS